MGKLSCLSVGCGDASILTIDSATYLFDCHNVGEHADLLPASKRLHGVFITHQHTDHFSGLGYLKDKGYKIDHLVYSPYERRSGDGSVTLEEWNEFNALRSHFSAQGTQLHSPYRQSTFVEPWWSPNGAKFWVLGPHKPLATAATREIHDASLVIKAQFSGRNVCFTGDASDALLQHVADNTQHYCGDILHVSHHGSLNGACPDFIKKASAKYAVISTKSGVYENVPHPTALSRYSTHVTEKVYRTDTGGTVTWTF